MEREEGYDNLENFKKYKNQIDIWYRTYNINRDKIILYRDFLTSLYNIVDETFLGIDVLHNEDDQKNHFNWCWNQVIVNFSKEKIYFKDKGIHYEYFWNFFFEAYYLSNLFEKEHNITGYIYKLFDFRYIKSSSELDILAEVYKLLDQNLKK
jgi:hypothetical protein